MANYILEITLLSPLISASGEGRVGIADRDVVFDDLGLPILPGRRLKGLWREAYRDVVEAWHQILSTQPTDRAAWTEAERDVVEEWGLGNEAPIPVKYIFGKSGKRPDKGSARLYVANAELQNADSLKEWLKYLQYRRSSSSWELQPEDVLQYFATVRAQTAMDRETGAALEDTLRLTRTLQPGLVFHAPVKFLKPPNDALSNALVLGASALKYMGVSRTRGLGKVRCRLINNLTEQVLSSASFPKINVVRSASSAQISTEQTDPSEIESNHDNGDLSEQSSTTETQHLLRYRLILKDPIVISGADGDPNTAVTRRDIPGSHVWGAAAWHYLQQNKHDSADPAFKQAFLNGNLRFLMAYPEACDKEPGQRLIPIPHALRQFKEDERLVDLLKKTPADLRNQPIKRIDRQYAKISAYKLETQVVKTERNYHHARAKDRRKGRALENDGTVFKYEAIQASQTFQGAVLGSEDDLRKLKEEWLEGLDTIKIGRSRSAQYGRATFEWMDDVPQKLDELSNEWDGFAKPRNAQSNMIFSLGKYLIITTLSSLLSVNLNGHPDVQFPKCELAERLKVDPKDLELLRSYTRTEMIGGYQTHLSLPKQQLPAIAAGSVFVFKFKGVQDFDEDRLLQLEHDGMGLRKGEGYGRIAVNRQVSLSLTGREEEHLDDPNEKSAPNVSDIRIPQEIQELLQTVIQARCLAEMQMYAIKIANQMKGNIPSNHLLGRLRMFLSHAAPAESLAKLREPVREKLEKYNIDMREFNMPMLTSEANEMTLHALFNEALTKPHTLTETLIEQHVGKLIEHHYPEVQQSLINILVDEYSTALCQDFLDYLLTVLHRKNKS